MPRKRKSIQISEDKTIEGKDDSLVKTVKEVAEDWLEAKKSKLASTTYNRYQEAFRRTIYPEYGDMLIEKITAEELDRFADSVAEKAENEGSKVNLSALQLSSGLLATLVEYAKGGPERKSLTSLVGERNTYEALSPEEIERVCAAVKYNQLPEMLAVILTLYCGIRIGELCALDWEDVNLEERSIFVHQSAHRIRVEDDEEKKTELQIAEIPTKSHIRTVEIPKEIVAYMEKFTNTGGCVLTGQCGVPAETRTLQNRTDRIFQIYKLKDMNFQRLRKTYVEGAADLKILSDVFGGRWTEKPYEGTLDKVWLTDEMMKDLPALRLLIGMTQEEAASILGVSAETYENIENGKQELSWSEYLTLLFLFRYNSKTEPVVDALGLYPQALKEKLAVV